MKTGKAEDDRTDQAAAPAWSLECAQDLTSLAYERVEELFVAMQIAPGADIRIQDLQERVGLGRTPVHQAVRRLAAETLLEVRPRNGLRVAPIDLTRERNLAELRRDVDRFVTATAIRNMSANDRAALHHLRRRVEAEFDSLSLDGFNAIDKSFDRLLIRASGERFLERTASPLQAFARRMGYLHITQISGRKGLAASMERHMAIMDHVLAGDTDAACSASRDLVAFSMSLISELEREIDPALLDVRFSAQP
ncbi:GntR family transcriptional regulator [Pannonibacter indicus]|uniref:DNA-binding transcriptional regulator, GntR family n=1 Tax=Pannonibacter indicus TaxID=466044 RepID=A0A0K6HS95_9HYPH|nr:GntR family transcriptional regulator [Pannonibacter indicus]CUA93917.1 DNA-binding transcriptional regulator, GntR family [Pannonibacter indicus]